MTDQATVLMYSPDAIGLGHVRRNSTIARAIVQERPEASVVLLVGSGAGAFFALPKGIDSIKLPSVQKVAAETWTPRSLNLSVPTTSTLRASMIRGIVRSLRPSVLVVDHLPLGIWGELEPTLEMIRYEGLETKVVLGLRDILDSSELVRSRWHKSGVYEAIEKYYHQVLIYGEKDIVPTADMYGLDRVSGDRVSYCGYVCEDTEARQAQPNEELPGLSDVQPGERVVIACGGGGHDAFPMLSATMDALERLDGDPTLRSVVIAGPLMASEKRSELADRASKLKRTTLLPRVTDCLHYLARADVSVIMGGYNSSLEALSTTSRIIMVPRPGPSAEQTMRAELMADKGHLQYVPLAQAEAAMLAEAIRTAAGAPPRHKNSKMLDGAGRAARTILSHVRADHAPPASYPSSKEASPYVLF